MKVALLFFSVLTSLSLWFTVPQTPAVECRGKSLPITLIPGPKMTGPSVPLRFGGTRPMPSPWVHSFHTEKGFRLVIKNRDEFSDFWKRLTSVVPPGGWVPELPEIDFSKEMIVVSAMGQKPSSGYLTIIDGACEVDDQIEVFISNVDNALCGGASLGILTYPADAVRIPRSDLPVVFRETTMPCPTSTKQKMPAKN